MPSLCFFVTNVVVFWFSTCEGVITSPPENTKYTFLPGQTVNITWVFDNAISTVVTRGWTLKNDTGPVENLAEILRRSTPDIRTKLYDVDVIKPATLVLKNINESYNGIYTFSVQLDGQVFLTRSVTVFIAEKPTVTLNSSSLVTLNEGDHFACLCKGEGGNPPANVTWCKDGVNCTDVEKENKTLVIWNARRKDNGTYKCVARSYPHNNYTDEKSIEVIVYIKPKVTTCSSPIIKNEGDAVTCECKCKGGNPPANCVWLKNGALTIIAGKEVNTLNLSSIKRTDGGNYTCEGESRPSVPVKKSITITVYYVTIEFSYSENNDNVTTTCTSNGPLLNYTIYHNGTEAARNMSYTISTKNGTHRGSYNCTAANELGELFAVKFLDASMGKPTQPIAPSSTTAQTVPSSSTPKGVTPSSDSVIRIVLIVGTTVVGLIGIVCSLVYYYKYKETPCATFVRWLYRVFNCGDNERENDDKNPNGSRVMANHYELEEDHGEGAGAYDTVKQSDDGEGSQDKKKPAGDSLPPVYASVNKENRQGNTLYASLDSEALRKPGSKKKQPETKNAPTEYASIDFMQTGKTPNADNA